MDNITWTQTARRQLRRIDRKQQQTIINAVDTLVDLRTARNITALTRHEHGYRLRVGRYRVMFDHGGNLVTIKEVVKRDERTY
jgi:mRNA interferase RelE/StbE